MALWLMWVLTNTVCVGAFLLSRGAFKKTNASNRTTSAAKAGAQIQSACDKLDKLWEVDSGRAAFAL